MRSCYLLQKGGHAKDVRYNTWHLIRHRTCTTGVLNEICNIICIIQDNRIILGAVGVLQFDVIAHRLKNEYNVDCTYESVNTATARWVTGDPKKMEEFKRKAEENLALDGGGNLTYLAPSNVNLNLTMERWKDLKFHATREH